MFDDINRNLVSFHYLKLYYFRVIALFFVMLIVLNIIDM